MLLDNKFGDSGACGHRGTFLDGGRIALSLPLSMGTSSTSCQPGPQTCYVNWWDGCLCASSSLATECGWHGGWHYCQKRFSEGMIKKDVLILGICPLRGANLDSWWTESHRGSTLVWKSWNKSSCLVWHLTLHKSITDILDGKSQSAVGGQGCDIGAWL